MLEVNLGYAVLTDLHAVRYLCNPACRGLRILEEKRKARVADGQSERYEAWSSYLIFMAISAIK